MASGDYGDHAEGLQTTASGSSGAHAEGVNTEASGSSSHAEGDTSKSTGISSHAEGVNTLASGDFGSHAEGVNTEASGHYGAHAAGWYTKATEDYQTVIGKYNALDSNNQATDAAFVIGGGDSTTRKDIFSVDWNGKATAGADATNNMDLTTLQQVNTALADKMDDDFSNASGILPITKGGTGASTIAKAKANLGIGNETQNPYLSNYTGSKQHWGINAVVTNTNNTNYEGKRTAFVLENDGMYFYNSTDGQTIWNMDDLGSLDYRKSIDGSSFNKNFKLISTSDRYSNYHKRSMFSWDSSTKSNFSNIPTVLNLETGSVVGIREVYWRNSINILVKVTEMYPNYGREHWCFYNNGSWSAWYCKGAGYLMSELNNSGASDYSRIIIVPTYNFNNLGVASNVDESDFTKAWLKKICEKYPNYTNCIFIGAMAPNSRRTVMCHIYNTSTVDSNGLPEASFGNVWTYDGQDVPNILFGTKSYAWYYRKYSRPYTMEYQILGTDAQTISSGTWTRKGSITVGPGTYWFKFLAAFGTNTTGARALNISTSTSASNQEMLGTIQFATTNITAMLEITRVYTFTASTTVYFNMYQTSGSALSTYGRLQYMRVGVTNWV